MKNPVVLVLVVLMMVGTAAGQRERKILERVDRSATAAKARPEPPIAFSMLQGAANVIIAARPAVSDETLTNDAELIEDSLPAIQTVFSKKGFIESEAREATLYAWQELRIKKLDVAATLSPADLMHFVSGLGKLTIRTTPGGATIKIDGEPVKDIYGRDVRTDACRWPSAGRHHVILVLEGYETVDEYCVIDEEGEVVFDRKLKPIEKKGPE